MPGGAAGHLPLYPRHVDDHTRRKAVQGHADGLAMALPEQAQAQMLPKEAAHSTRPPSDSYTCKNSGQDLFSASTPVTVTGSRHFVAAMAASITMR